MTQYERAKAVMDILRQMPTHEQTHAVAKIGDKSLGYYDGDIPSHSYFLLKFDGAEVTFNTAHQTGDKVSNGEWFDAWMKDIENLVNAIKFTKTMVLDGKTYFLVEK